MIFFKSQNIFICKATLHIHSNQSRLDSDLIKQAALWGNSKLNNVTISAEKFGSSINSILDLNILHCISLSIFFIRIPWIVKKWGIKFTLWHYPRSIK